MCPSKACIRFIFSWPLNQTLPCTDISRRWHIEASGQRSAESSTWVQRLRRSACTRWDAACAIASPAFAYVETCERVKMAKLVKNSENVHHDQVSASKWSVNQLRFAPLWQTPSKGWKRQRTDPAGGSTHIIVGLTLGGLLLKKSRLYSTRCRREVYTLTETGTNALQ